MTPAQQTISVVGVVEVVIFAASDSLYKVLKIKVKQTDFDGDMPAMLTVVGQIDDNVTTGAQPYCFEGKFVQHPKFGKQFEVSSYHAQLPSERNAAIKFLAGERFAGIGQKTAEKIVSQLGANAVNLLSQQPEKIDSLTLKPKQKQSLHAGLAKIANTAQSMVKLVQVGFSEGAAGRLCKQFGSQVNDLLKTNPYALVATNKEFMMLDHFAMTNGIDKKFPSRIKAAILVIVKQYCDENASTYMPTSQVIEAVVDLLGLANDAMADVVQAINELAEDETIFVSEKQLYLHKYFIAEEQIATTINAMLKTPSDRLLSAKQAKQAVLKMAQKTRFKLGNQQKLALQSALQHQLFILTGGPGTGKTTIVNTLVKLYCQLHDINQSKLQTDTLTAKSPIILAAPTGRAAKRLSEATNLPASTLHRLLRLAPNFSEQLFGQKNHTLPAAGKDINADSFDDDDETITAKLVIIDETSMVDTFLMAALLKRLSPASQLVLVGDCDQLPSVGAGQVLADLLSIDQIAHVKLDEVFRQSSQSTIIPLAQMVRVGKLPADFAAKKPDRSFIAAGEGQVAAAISQIIEIAKNHNLAADKMQVLAPMHSGAAGITHINNVLQGQLNPMRPDVKQLRVGDYDLRIGDRVLNLLNDAASNVYNGDIGRVVSIVSKAQKLADTTKMSAALKEKLKQPHIVVDFDGNERIYTRDDWHNLTLAYCMSIHKSQGSEFPVVILPLVVRHARMLARNLLYTAITRAKQKLVMLGQIDAFAQAAKTIAAKRQTGLVQRYLAISGEETEQALKTAASKQLADDDNSASKSKASSSTKQLTVAMIATNQIDPRVGMAADVVPAAFMPGGKYASN